MSNYTALPTETARLMFKSLSATLHPNQVNVLGALFQRLSLVSTFEDAVDALKLQLKLTPEDLIKLELVYRFTKSEVLGLAVETLTEVARSQLTAQKDRILASQVLNDLYGEKELIKDQVLTDRVVLNLVRQGT